MDDIEVINDSLTTLSEKTKKIDSVFNLVNNLHRRLISSSNPSYSGYKKHPIGEKEIFNLCRIFDKDKVATDYPALLLKEGVEKLVVESKGLDAVILSNIHRQRNVGQYLDTAYSALKIGGVLVLLSPVFSNNVGSGNTSSLWNAGYLIYNLIMAGFDCKFSKVSTFENEIQISAYKTDRRAKNFAISEVVDFFPIEVYQHFDGHIKEVNWYKDE